MRRPNAWKRAAPVLKTVFVVTAVLVFTHAVIQIRAAGLVVALVLGLLVVVALSLENRILMAVAGVGFLLAAGAHLLLPTVDNGGFFSGNGSTFSLWLAWGIGLIGLAAKDDPETTEEPYGNS
jgi:hypothetical protein